MAESQSPFIDLDFQEYPVTQMRLRARQFRQEMTRRRSVRDFSTRPVPDEVIRECLRTAGSAPSGANHQPWHFAVIHNPVIKRRIRVAAEQEEQEFYQRRAPDEWLEALRPLGTNADKPFLELAPCLIVAFAEKMKLTNDGSKRKNYYVTESASLATGLLVTALHHAGLATLTHTPSPMKFLNRILSRPDSEKPLMVVVTGYPASGARVPHITRKSLDEFTSFHD